MGRNAEGKLVEDRPCVLCRYLGLASDSPAEFHHVREGRLGKRGDLGLPLCDRHHRNGPDALHVLGKRAFQEKYGVTELDLLDMC